MYAIRPLTAAGEPLSIALAFNQQELIEALMLALQRSPHVVVIADRKEGAASECIQPPTSPKPTLSGEAQPQAQEL